MTLIYDTEKGQRSYNITVGVPQGSSLGVKLVGSSDDIPLVVYGESIEEVK